MPKKAKKEQIDDLYALYQSNNLLVSENKKLQDIIKNKDERINSLKSEVASLKEENDILKPYESYITHLEKRQTGFLGMLLQKMGDIQISYTDALSNIWKIETYNIYDMKTVLEKLTSIWKKVKKIDKLSPTQIKNLTKEINEYDQYNITNMLKTKTELADILTSYFWIIMQKHDELLDTIQECISQLDCKKEQ